jgi:hypothetical protein
MLISQSLEMETSMCKMTSHCRVLARSDADASGAKMHHAHMTLHPSCPITSCNHLCESNLHQSTLSAPFFNAKLYAARALPDFCRYANINSNSKWMQMDANGGLMEIVSILLAINFHSINELSSLSSALPSVGLRCGTWLPVCVMAIGCAVRPAVDMPV